MKTCKLILIAFLITGFISGVSAQEYDVLEKTGRNELFHDYLLEEFDNIIEQRKTDVEASLASKESVLARQKDIRNRYLNLIGELPEKTDLAAEVVGTIEPGSGYKIEKIVYQSVPNHHVTANFYIPDGDGPFPAVIICCGHYPVAKPWSDYQNLSILFAKNGIAALIVDPICQGERYQITDNTGKLTFKGQSGTAQQARLEVGSILNGTSITAYQLWDNHRGVDYLYSRTDVIDTTRIGCAGHSGGGAQATNLLAYDQRLKVGAVANFITNETNNFKILGPQTASQNLAFEGENGIDNPDYITMCAPKPYMIIGTDGDFFEIEGVRETYEEAQKIYDKLGAAEKIKKFETDDGVHDFIKVKREAAVRWFKIWFLNNNDTVIEANQTTQNQADLNVTASGQVMTEYADEKNITALNLELAESYAASREAFWKDNAKEECISKIKELIRYEELSEAPTYEAVEDIKRDDYKIEKGKISYKDHIPVTSLTFIPNENTNKLPAVLYVDGRGKKTDARDYGLIEQIYRDSGYLVMSIDVRGFGETADNSGANGNESKYNNKEHRNGVISLYIGKTLVGQRVQDIQKALAVLGAREDVDASSIKIVGIGRASVAVLHAAAIDERIKNVVIRKSEKPLWHYAIADPTIPDQMTHEVPSALKYYDLTGLIENGIAPREVVFAEEPELKEKKEDPTSIKKADTGKTNFLNFPNPFNDKSQIEFTLQNRSDVSLEIYRNDGKKIKVINKPNQAAGNCIFNLTAKNFAVGMYIYKLKINNEEVATQKMVITK